ncbi:MAG TPA: diaminopimelate decarboxylase [Acidimicrobiales bacterium]|nr:diaminopimelate decarboxylase [Acidimicrobiales bacterium]
MTSWSNRQSSPSEEGIGAHLLPVSAYSQEGGHLVVAGVRVEDIAAEFDTPFFLYDEEHLRERCREIVAAFGRGAAFATKSFLTKAMALIAFEEGMSLDVSTGGELAVVLAAGVPATHIVFHGNNKSRVELETAVSAGVGRIVVDSFDEIERLIAIDEIGEMRISIRVNPGVEAHTHEYIMTGQEDSKFGFSLGAGVADHAIERLRAHFGERVDGVHAHIGSQIVEFEGFALEVELLAPFVERHELSEFVVGGGLGVAYCNDEVVPSLTSWAEDIRAHCARAGIASGVALGVEPGRAIVATAGMTCYRIGTIKEIVGVRTYVAVDGGMSDNPRPVLYGSGYEAFLARDIHAPRQKAVRVVGRHCESGDVIVFDGRLPVDTVVGDLLITPVTGAYGFSMASNYNRVCRPPVLFVADGEVKVVVRRETIEDLLRLEP